MFSVFVFSYSKFIRRTCIGEGLKSQALSYAYYVLCVMCYVKSVRLSVCVPVCTVCLQSVWTLSCLSDHPACLEPVPCLCVSIHAVPGCLEPRSHEEPRFLGS